MGYTFKNENTTLGFTRFDDKGEVEYLINPIFRKRFSKETLKITEEKLERS